MNILFSMPNNLYPEKLRKKHEYIRCTYPIRVENTDYVWMMFIRFFTEKLVGLALYNCETEEIEASAESLDKLITALYGYFCIFNRDFTEKIPDLLLNYEEFWCMGENVLSQTMRKLNKKDTRFRREIMGVLEHMREAEQREKPIYHGLLKYNNLILDIKSTTRRIPAQLLIQFCKDVEVYHKTTTYLQNDFICWSRDFKNILIQMPNEPWLGNLTRLLWEYNEHLKRLQRYEQIPYVENIIKNNFDKRVLDPYIALIRTDKGVLK